MKYYMICSSSQSGTKFLCAYLRHLKIGRPTELFSDNQLSELKGINQLIQLGSQGRDYWGIKVFYGQLSPGINKLKELSRLSTTDDFKVLNTLFPGIKFVYYVRINKIKQAISQLKAGQIDRFNRDMISRAVTQKVSQDAQWLSFFDRHHIIPYVLTYEELCRDTVATLSNLLRFLKFDDIENLDEALSGASLPKRQYNEINEDWYQKYLQK